MAFRNSILAGEELVRSGIRSPNYVAGVSGWRIAQDGSAEFNNVTVRGSLRTSDVDGAWIEIIDAPGFRNGIIFETDRAGEVQPAEIRVDNLAATKGRLSLGASSDALPPVSVIFLASEVEANPGIVIGTRGAGGVILSAGAAAIAMSRVVTIDNGNNTPKAAPKGTAALGVDPNARLGFTVIQAVSAATTLTFWAEAGREYEFSFGALIVATAVNTGVIFMAREGATERARLYQDNDWPAVLARSERFWSGAGRYSWAVAGNKTVALAVQRTGAAGAVDVRGDLVETWFRVKDVGVA